jgi:hypothetical protein
MKTMSLKRWRTYFPFLDDRPDLAAEYDSRYHSFIQQADDSFEAILYPDYRSLLSASTACSFCHIVVQALEKCYRSAPTVPGTNLREGIMVYPPVALPEEDIDELRSTSPAVWFEASVLPHDANPGSLLLALEDIVLTVKLANTFPFPRFLLSNVRLAQQSLSRGVEIGAPNTDAGIPHTGNVHLDLAKQWLQACRVEHCDCAEQDSVNATLPTRLLDLNAGLGDDVVLRITSSLEPKDRSAYATLSHRWGDQVPPATTLQNLERNLLCVPFVTLPKTFQEAVSFTREMRIRYLWIDSLCIIQDSTVDKDHEIPRMVDVYSYAAFNIAACAGADASAGLFNARASPQIQPQQLDLAFALPDESRCTVTSTLSPILRQTQGSRQEKNNELDHRGWVFQERTFSRRVFSFEKELFWFECSEGISSENLPGGGPRKPEKWNNLLPSRKRDYGDLNGHLLHALRIRNSGGKIAADNSDDAYKEHVDEVYRSWFSAIPGYLLREFKFETDRLPGISGLASRIHAATGDTYMAGLWKRQLIRGLCWSLVGGGRHSGIISDSRAPSWSWAKMKGPSEIQYPPLSPDMETLVEVIDAWTRPAGANLFGDAVAGELRVRGRLKQGRAWSVMAGSSSESNWHVASLFDSDTDFETSGAYVRGGFARIYMDLVADYTEAHQPVWILPLMAFWPVVHGQRKGKKLFGLALKADEGETFSRVGFFWRLSRGSDLEWDETHEDGEGSWFGTGCETKEITIV